MVEPSRWSSSSIRTRFIASTIYDGNPTVSASPDSFKWWFLSHSIVVESGYPIDSLTMPELHICNAEVSVQKPRLQRSPELILHYWNTSPILLISTFLTEPSPTMSEIITSPGMRFQQPVHMLRSDLPEPCPIMPMHSPLAIKRNIIQRCLGLNIYVRCLTIIHIKRPPNHPAYNLIRQITPLTSSFSVHGANLVADSISPVDANTSSGTLSARSFPWHTVARDLLAILPEKCVITASQSRSFSSLIIFMHLTFAQGSSIAVGSSKTMQSGLIATAQHLQFAASVLQRVASFTISVS